MAFRRQKYILRPYKTSMIELFSENGVTTKLAHRCLIESPLYAFAVERAFPAQS